MVVREVAEGLWEEVEVAVEEGEEEEEEAVAGVLEVQVQHLYL